MKHVLIFCLIACFYGIYAVEDEMRLIRFNETYTKWMSTKEVEEMVNECAGRAGHTGFIDITMDPTFVPKPQRTVSIPGGPRHQQVVNRLIPQISGPKIWSTIGQLSAYQTRYYTSNTGVTAVRWMESQYQACAGNRLGNDIEVQLFGHQWAQPSIVATIIGTRFPQTRVIIGGHIDSTSNGATAPGADDDASGSATVLEIFCILARDGFRPDYTLEFHAYAAEEVGLRGSGDIARAYYLQNIDVRAMMQLDMTGWAGTRRVIGIVQDYTNVQLTNFLRTLVPAYCDIDLALTSCGYGCSDHASWTAQGYPACFAFESVFSGSNPNIHTVRDQIGVLDQAHSVEFCKLGLAFMVELAYPD